MTVENKRYVCEVLLPEGSPIRSAVGKPSSRKALAKRSAAFEMCLLLRSGNWLDSNLMPTIKKYLPAMRNAHLALSMNKGNTYNMKMKPDLWERTRGSVPDRLFVTILQLEKPEELGRPSQPLALLTRTAMPDFPAIILSPQMDKTSTVLCRSMTNAYPVTSLAMEKLHDFTLRVYKDVFNKIFENDMPNMSYWFAPILDRVIIDKDSVSPDTLIDWQSVDFVYEHGAEEEHSKWSRETPDSQLANRFLVDRWTGERRFFSIGVQRSLNIHDPVPEGAPRAKLGKTIIDYTLKMFKNSKGRAETRWDPEQPVVLAEVIKHRSNWLDNRSEKDETPTQRCYICPEPLIISTVCLSLTVCMAAADDRSWPFQ
jgi:endoribonuclease Dicer